MQDIPAPAKTALGGTLSIALNSVRLHVSHQALVHEGIPPESLALCFPAGHTDCAHFKIRQHFEHLCFQRFLKLIFPLKNCPNLIQSCSGKHAFFESCSAPAPWEGRAVTGSSSRTKTGFRRVDFGRAPALTALLLIFPDLSLRCVLISAWASGSTAGKMEFSL